MLKRKNLNVAMSFLAVIFVASFAFAAEAEVPRADLAAVKGLLGIAAGIGMGLASLGGALGQGKAIAAALEGIARNPGAQPKVFIPMLVGLALVESLVILAFVVCSGLKRKEWNGNQNQSNRVFDSRE